MQARIMRSEDLPAVQGIWNAAVNAGEVLYYPLTDAYFQQKFCQGPGCEPENLLVIEKDGAVAGFLHGVAPVTFPLAKPGCAYLTCLLIRPDARGRGLGKALLDAFKARMKERGAHTLYISSLNPVNLDWHIPGTPGHDHNNMPGLDTGCAGFGFFAAQGFVEKHREVSLYQDLSGYAMPREVPVLQKKLAADGIFTGVYQPEWNCEFDGMCDRVGSDYWRDVLRTEIAAWRAHAPNADSRFWPDGRRHASSLQSLES